VAALTLPRAALSVAVAGLAHCQARLPRSLGGWRPAGVTGLLAVFPNVRHGVGVVTVELGARNILPVGARIPESVQKALGVRARQLGGRWRHHEIGHSYHGSPYGKPVLRAIAQGVVRQQRHKQDHRLYVPVSG